LAFILIFFVLYFTAWKHYPELRSVELKTIHLLSLSQKWDKKTEQILSGRGNKDR